MHSHGAVNKRLTKRYQKQRSRGSDGFGFVAFTDKKITHYYRHHAEAATLKTLKKIRDTHVLFHHRYPTSTENVKEAAHPIKVEHKELQHTYYVVHNGVISNPGTLKSKHEKLGYSYTTTLKTQYVTANGTVYLGDTKFNDSEALAIELVRNLEKGTRIEAKGTAAFIVLQVTKDNKHVKALYYGNNGGNPLTADHNKKALTLASEGGSEVVPAMLWHRYDYATHKIATFTLDMARYEPTTYYTSPYGYNFNYEDDYTPVKSSKKETNSKTYLEEANKLEQELAELNASIQIAETLKEEEELEDLQEQREALYAELEAVYEDIEAEYAAIKF
jgi:glucosamine 6-phosphate synthetase-like amidotransferase/phosphosugar isomerase protein